MNDGMEEQIGIPIDKNVFQVSLQTEVVLVMTLQMAFSIKNWTLINFVGKIFMEEYFNYFILKMLKKIFKNFKK